MLLTKDCQEFPAEVSSNVVRDAAGEPIAIIGMAQNVAYRELAEKTLQASEERYRALVETITHGVGEIDTTGTIIFTNPALNRILGYPPGELIGRKVWSMVSGDHDPLQAYIETLVRDHPRPHPYHGTWATKGGHLIQVQIDWDYKWDEKEYLVGFISIITDVTERKRAEEQLRQLASRHEAILSEIPDIIMEVDANKVYTWANPAGYTFFGKDVIGKEAATYFEEEQDTYNKVKPLFNGQSSVFYVESWQRRKDGQRRLLAWWCQSLKDQDGQVVGALSTARDITEARQAEQLLKHEQARLESIFLAAPIGIGVVCNRVIQRVNERLCVMTGYSKEELLDQNARMLYPSQEEFERVGREKYADIRKVGMGSIETQWRRKDGTLIDIFLSSAPLDPNDWSVGVTFTALDITQRKLAEQALRESEERFHLAVQGANDGLWDWPDMRQDRQWWSPRFYTLLGYKEVEIEATNSNFNRLVHPDDLEKVLAITHTRREEGQPFDVEYRLRTKSGEYRWFSSRGAVVRNREGEPMRMSGFIRDITDRRKTVAERATYQARLKSLATQLALAEERERRRIAVGVHDDIGQKLVLAKLELQSLRQTISESGLAQGVDHVCDLIDQTMQDARSLAFDLSNPVLYEVGFDAAVEAWLNRQVERKTGIRCDFASDLTGTKLDETMAVALFQAVREVLTNVIKHAQAKTLKVRICKVKDQVQVTVEDDGVGFDPAVLEWSTESQRGLGLFNVKERIEYLKGHLEVRSTPGQGTTVILAAPFKAATATRQRLSS
jgi:PAS domain S-box-containing protein